MSPSRMFAHHRLFRLTARVVALLVATVAAGVTALTLSTAPAWASHFRAAELSWSRSDSSSRTVTFEATESFRRNYASWTAYYATGGGTATAPNVGDVIQDGNTRLSFGDGTSAIDPYLLVTTVDAANNTLTAEAINSSTPTSGHLTHAFPSSSAAYTVSLIGCCRLGSPYDSPPAGHMNNPDVSTQILSYVGLNTGATSGASSSLPPIVDCPKNSPCNFTIPVAAPSDETVSYALSAPHVAAAYNSYGDTFTQPSGAAVDQTSGLFTWNTTNQPLASSIHTGLDTYYSAQVTATAKNSSGIEVSSVAIDFFLRITNQTNAQPVWSTSTPADGTVVDATPGEPVSVNVGATDPDATDTVTLGVLNKPSDATFTTTSGNTATGSFAWTPSAEGTTLLNFTATDNHGLSALQRSVKIVATKKAPTLTWATPSSIVFGTPLGTDQLNAALSTATGALTPPNPGTFTYVPGIGTVLHGGDNTLQVTWTPDSADATGWSSVVATVTLTVNKAGQTLNWDPPIDDSTVHTYGDAPFTVNATSDAGLPVTYGAGDACSSTPQTDGSTQIAITAAGSCTVTADQTGNGDYAPAAQISHAFSIAKQTPTLSVSPANTTYNPAGDIGSAQLDASLTPSAAGSAGSVTYTIDGAALPSNNVVPAGEHTLTAVYTPSDASGNFNPTSATAKFTVAQAQDHLVTLTGLAPRTVGDTFSVVATTASGLPVSWTAVNGNCAIDATGQASALHAGNCGFLPTTTGDNNWLPISYGYFGFTIAKASQAITGFSPADMTYLDGAQQLAATGGASGLPVTFVALPASVCTLTNGSSLTINGAGDCTVTASQAGNDDYTAAANVIRVVHVAKATPVISWSAPAPISYGTPLGGDQLNATTIPAGITGDFSYTLDDGTTPALGALLHASSAPQTLRVTFTPADPDSDNFNPASGQTTIHVNKADQTITWTQVPTSATYGDAPFAVAAKGGASGNAVVFSAEPGSACFVSGTTVTITAAGPCVLVANQDGNSDFNPAETSSQSVTVAQQTPVIHWDTPAHITYGTALGASQLNATVTPDEAAANGSVAYSTDAATGDAAGQVLHAGTHALTASYSPNSTGPGTNYTSATKTVYLVVDQASQQISGFASIPTHTYGDLPLSLSATGGASGKPVYFTVDAGSACATSGTNGTTLTLTGAGSCTVIAHQDGNADYNPAPDVAQSFTINQAAQTISFGVLPTAYVGDAALTLSATGGGSGNPVTFAAGPAAVCTATSAGVLTIVGPGSCSVTASQAGNANYLAATPVTRTFAVAYRLCVLFDQSKVNNSGSTVPIKVTTCTLDGKSTATSTVVLHATGVDGGPVNAPGNSQPGNNFRFTTSSGGSYQFNEQTTGLTAGTHRFTFTIGADPTEHSVTFVIG